MKRKIILLNILILYSAHIKAQYGYAGISIGYGTGLPVYSLDASTKITGTSTTHTLEKGNFGQGLNFGINTGHMFNQNVGIELGGYYLIGSKKEFNNSGFETDTLAGTTTETDETITLDKLKMIRFNPSLKFTLGEEVRPFLRLGIILGLGASYTRTEETISTTTGSVNHTAVKEIVREYSGGTSFGFSSAFGTDVDLTDNLVLFFEINFSSLSWAATESKIVRYIDDGIDILPTLNPSSLETQYVDDYTVSQNNSNSNKELKTYLPFGNLGITAGVVYKFGVE